MPSPKTASFVSLEQPLKVVPKPEETKADANRRHPRSTRLLQDVSRRRPRAAIRITSDVQEYHVHGGMTHLDALCHDSSDGKLYTGTCSRTPSTDTTGCTKLGLDNVKEASSRAACWWT